MKAHRKPVADERSRYSRRSLRSARSQGAPLSEVDYFSRTASAAPIDKDQWRKDCWYTALRAKRLRERDFYRTRHTLIRLALTVGENIKAIADPCSTSPDMMQQHYGRYMNSDFGARLMANRD
jgi:hypothetical protein